MLCVIWGKYIFFFKYLSCGGTQRRALPRHQSEKMKIYNISLNENEPPTCHVYSHTPVPAP